MDIAVEQLNTLPNYLTFTISTIGEISGPLKSDKTHKKVTTWGNQLQSSKYKFDVIEGVYLPDWPQTGHLRGQENHE